MITKTSEEEGVVYLSAVARCWEYIEGYVPCPARVCAGLCVYECV